MSSARAGTARSAPAARGLHAAGLSDAGRQREVNEDRLHIDVNRGVFMVIDGVGGHAAGGKAADIALTRVRERLERETGPVANRIREAIAIANNEICRLASTRPEWDGMACVLTVAVVEDGLVTVGHVGDTRLYKLRDGRLEKITRDHSPVGEREDAGELTEAEAMRHPRRNEVYRDVGSDPHDPSDADFVDVKEIPFESDAALLLCSDGLTDLIDTTRISRVVERDAGRPDAVVCALIDAANEAGGKDNVTVVYVEGDRFARPAANTVAVGRDPDTGLAAGTTQHGRTARGPSIVRLMIVALLMTVVGLALGRSFDWVPMWNAISWLPAFQAAVIPPAPPPTTQVVGPSESIAAALKRATPGTQVIVEPGEYREQLFLRDGVRVVSRVSGAAVLRLPASANDGAAVVATNLSSAELAGFRIVGDAATPLGVGIFLDDAAVVVSDVDISGAARAGVEFGGGRPATLLASDIHDNPGAAIVVQRTAAPRIAHNTFRRNGASERGPGALQVDAGAAPLFRGNVFVGLTADAFAALEQATQLPLGAENWHIPPPDVRGARPRTARPPQGKQ